MKAAASLVAALFLVGERRVDRKQGRAVGFLGLARLERVGDDLHDGLAQSFFRQPQGNRVVVALGHLAAVMPGQHRDVFVHHGFRQYEMFAEMVVEALGNVARHFQVLDLLYTK